MANVWRRQCTIPAIATRLLLAAAAICAWGTPSHAQNAVATGSVPPGAVQVSITPYTWLSGLSGTAGYGPATGNIDLTFGDILKQLHFAAMTAARADFGRWHVTLDVMYLSTGQDTGPIFAGAGGVSLHSKSLIVTAAAGYRLVDAAKWNLEGFAGLRGWDLMNRAIFSAPALGSREVEFDQGWVDPIIGLQAAYRITPKLALIGAFDVGGFSVGSRFTTQLTAVARWSFNPSVSAFAGYRYLYVDYDRNKFLYDVSMHGPLIGATFRF